MVRVPPWPRQPCSPSGVGAAGAEPPLPAVLGSSTPRCAGSGSRRRRTLVPGPLGAPPRPDSPGRALPRVRLAFPLLPLATVGVSAPAQRVTPLLVPPVRRVAPLPRPAMAAVSLRAAAPRAGPALHLVAVGLPGSSPAAARARLRGPLGSPRVVPLRLRFLTRKAPRPLGPRLRRAARSTAGLLGPPPALRTGRRPPMLPAVTGLRVAARAATAAAIRRAAAWAAARGTPRRSPSGSPGAVSSPSALPARRRSRPRGGPSPRLPVVDLRAPPPPLHRPPAAAPWPGHLLRG